MDGSTKELIEEFAAITQCIAKVFVNSCIPGKTEEQRSALLTAGTDAIAIPKALDDKIWDNIYTNHPILGDIDIKRTGVILEVTKHTKVKAGKAGKEAFADAEKAKDEGGETWRNL